MPHQRHQDEPAPCDGNSPITPGDPWNLLFCNLGLVYTDTGRLAEALQSMRRALDLDPANARMHSTIASLYRALGDAERASFHLEQAQQTGA